MRTIAGNLRGTVLQGRVAETQFQALDVIRRIDALRRVQHFTDFRPQLVEQIGNQRQAHGIGHGFTAGQLAHVGKRRVRTVEAAQLHVFPALDFIGENRPDLVPLGTSHGELIFDDPLIELLGHDRPGVFHADHAVDVCTVGVGGRRGDAVNHGAGEADIGFDPAGQIGVGFTGEGQHGGLRQLAVVRQVIAAHHGEGLDALGLASLQGLYDQAENGLGRGR